MTKDDSLFFKVYCFSLMLQILRKIKARMRVRVAQVADSEIKAQRVGRLKSWLY